MSSDWMTAGTVSMRSGRGDDIEAYHAAPTDADSYGSVVVIHHMPGYDSATKEIARRFAAHGYGAVVPNLFHRFAPGALTGRCGGGRPCRRRGVRRAVP